MASMPALRFKVLTVSLLVRVSVSIGVPARVSPFASVAIGVDGLAYLSRVCGCHLEICSRGIGGGRHPPMIEPTFR